MQVSFGLSPIGTVSVDKRPQNRDRDGYVMALAAPPGRSATTNGDTHNKLTERIGSWFLFVFQIVSGQQSVEKGGQNCAFWFLRESGIGYWKGTKKSQINRSSS